MHARIDSKAASAVRGCSRELEIGSSGCIGSFTERRCLLCLLDLRAPFVARIPAFFRSRRQKLHDRVPRAVRWGSDTVARASRSSSCRAPSSCGASRSPPQRATSSHGALALHSRPPRAPVEPVRTAPDLSRALVELFHTAPGPQELPRSSRAPLLAPTSSRGALWYCSRPPRAPVEPLRIISGPHELRKSPGALVPTSHELPRSPGALLPAPTSTHRA